MSFKEKIQGGYYPVQFPSSLPSFLYLETKTLLLEKFL